MVKLQRSLTTLMLVVLVASGVAQADPLSRLRNGLVVGGGLSAYSWTLTTTYNSASQLDTVNPAPGPFVSVGYLSLPLFKWGWESGFSMHQFSVDGDSQSLYRLDADALYLIFPKFYVHGGINFSNFTDSSTGKDDSGFASGTGFQLGALYTHTDEINFKGSLFSMTQNMGLAVSSVNSRFIGVEFSAQYRF